MPDTSSTPASDRPADLLRAAAVRAREMADPLHTVLAPLLEAVAVDAIRCRCVPECPTLAALAVARQLLGTTEGAGPIAEPSADRRARYEEALWVHALNVAAAATDAMAVADSEIAAAHAALRRGNSRLVDEIAQLRAELAAAPPAPADRAATRDRIRRAICEASGFTWLPDELMEPDEYGEHADAVLAVLDAPADRAAILREAADHFDGQHMVTQFFGHQVAAELRRLAGEAAAGVQQATEGEARPDDIQVWPLTRILTEVRCGSQDWTWDQEWADLDQRHAESGYLDRLEQQIKANGITMPVLIGSDGRLWDGHHRLRIAVRLGIAYVPVEVTPAAVAPAQEVARG
ncbi:ParB N-terminal domain-containing protein [Streptomyces sp. NPDC058629]|uniref:ParB N-terminal domain-containing protein n=1 Tax=Streptomyces sp. NPDC058629 TaxID=3346565 RepID=UPI003656C1D7